MRPVITFLKLPTVLFVSLSVVAACGPVPHPEPKDLLACTEVDIGKTLPEIGTTIFEYVVSIIAAGKDGWKNKLTLIGVNYGVDVLACAVKAAHDALNAHPPGVAATATPAARRADEFIAERGWAYR